jgi:hypothetical protein
MSQKNTCAGIKFEDLVVNPAWPEFLLMQNSCGCAFLSVRTFFNQVASG